MERKYKLGLRQQSCQAAWKLAIRRFLGALIVCTFLLAARPALAVQIIESGLQANRMSQIFWISPEEVVFNGLTEEYIVRESDSFRKRVSRITTWNIRTKEIKQFEKADSGPCYDKGIIAYAEVDFSPVRVWTSIGRLGGEITREERTFPFSSLTCQPRDAVPPLPEWTKERWIMRLRPEHGFVDLGPNNDRKNTPIRLFRPGSETAVELPIGQREFVQARVRYFPFKGAYFFESDYFVSNPRHPYGGSNLGPWPKGVARPVWWVYPDGRVEEITIPYAVWMRREIVPTKAGLLAIDPTWFTITGEKPFDGIYLIDGKGGGQRFSGGVFGANAVSADGCRFAVTREPEPGVRQPGYWTVTVLDFCQRD